MKNLLSKSLLCGVLATSFLIINCQKAPDRPVKAAGADSSKPAPFAFKEATCTDNEITKYDDAVKAAATLSELLATAKPDKAEMEAKLKDLSDKTDLANKAIAALKAGDGKDSADLCKTVDADPKKVRTLKPSDLTGAYLRLKNFVEQKGGTAPIDTLVVDTLKSDDYIKLSEDMSSRLSNASADCISDKAFMTSDKCEALKAADINATICSIKGDGNAVEKDSVAQIKVNADSSKPNTLSLMLTMASKDPKDGNRLMSIDCNLGKGITADKAAEEVTRVLGALVSKTEAPVPPKIESIPQAGPAASAKAAKPAAATNVSTEELNQLATATSSK